MAQDTLLRVKKIEVDGLFNRYHHEVDLNLNDRATILFGPNGVGKTVLLGMTEALCNSKWRYFTRVTFRSFAITLTDGTRLEISTQETSRQENERTFQCTLARPGQPEWKDEILADSIISSLQQKPEIEGLLGRLKIRLIGAQRLLRPRKDWRHVRLPRLYGRKSSSDQSFSPSEEPNDREADMVSTMQEIADDFKQRLETAMARFGQKSQILDQSFPYRLLDNNWTRLTPAQLKDRMIALNKRSSEYKEIGVLDETKDNFDPQKLDGLGPEQIGAMSLYLQNMEEKLDTLAALVHRTRLFFSNVNRKFEHKQVKIDKNKGLVATGEDGNQLELRSLSSGEQHELVLHYELLFIDQPNTLVLIDEPEISLHVLWQENFLPDLLDVLRTVNIDALIATHSPYIVGDRDDLMVGLKG